MLAVKESYIEMEEEAGRVGLVISERKTEYLAMKCKQGSRVGQDITMDAYNLEVCIHFST